MKNNSLYQRQLNISIDGQSSNDLMEDILSVKVKQNLCEPSECILTVQNELASGVRKDIIWRHRDKLAIGKEVSVSIGTTSTEVFGGFLGDTTRSRVIFTGSIETIKLSFTSTGEAIHIVNASDKLYNSTLGNRFVTYANKTDSQIAREVIKRIGLAAGKIKETKIVNKYLCQANKNDLEFLRWLAFRNGFIFYVRENKGYFCSPGDGSNSIKVSWLTSSDSNTVVGNSIMTGRNQGNSIGVARQPREYNFTCWDPKQKKTELFKTSEPSHTPSQTHGIAPKGSQLSEQLKCSEATYNLPFTSTPDGLKIHADSYCGFHRSLYEKFDLDADGCHFVRPGDVLSPEKNLGDYDRSKLFISGVCHTYKINNTDESGGKTDNYTTQISALDVGKYFESNLASHSRAELGQTFLIGLVTDNEDPEKMGRVKVKFPTLSAEHTSDWARVVSVGAGKKRGIDWLPEIDDEVLVGFELGDIHRPFVMGGLWNGKDEPPVSVENSVSNDKVRLRTIETRTGHKIQFIEEDKEDSKAGIEIVTTAGHQIYFNDSDERIVIQSRTGHQIVLDDKTECLEINSIGALKLSANKEIEINSKSTIKLSARRIELN